MLKQKALFCLTEMQKSAAKAIASFRNGEGKRLLSAVRNAISSSIAAIHRHQSGIRYYGALILLITVLVSGAYFLRNGEPAQYRSAASVSEPSASEVPCETGGHAEAAEPEPPEYLPPVSGTVICGFDAVSPVWSESLSQWQLHAAVDFSAMPGEAVFAACDGRILEIYEDPMLGNTIELLADNGDLIRYSSLSTLNMVVSGQRIARGEIISGAGECAAEAERGTHVHVEYVSEGRPADFAATVLPEPSA